MTARLVWAKELPSLRSLLIANHVPVRQNVVQQSTAAAVLGEMYGWPVRAGDPNEVWEI